MTEHIQLTKTWSQMKTCQITQTQWEDFFNEDHPNEGVNIAV